MKFLSSLALIISLLLPMLSLAGQQQQFKVLQLNAWLLDPLGIKIAHDLKDRRKLMPAWIAKTGADIISFQEVWRKAHKKYLIRELKKLGYEYALYTGNRLLMGNGLLIVSKFPIGPSFDMMKFSVHTRFDEIIAKKGAIKLNIQVPKLGWIDFYDSHVGAVGFDEKTGNYKEKQKEKMMIQMRELAEWIKQTRTSAVTLLSADLNANYQNYVGHQFVGEFAADYEYLVKNTCGHNQELINSYLTANHKSVNESLEATYDVANPYVSSGFFKTIPSEVEDYIFMCPNKKLSVLESKRVFTEALSESVVEEYNLRKLPLRLTDHYGVLSTFGY